MNLFKKNDLVEIAVQLEDKGFKFYDAAANKPNISEKVKNILIHLRDEESKHRATFLELRNKVDLFDLKETKGWDEAVMYMNVVLDSHIFSGDDASIKLVAASKDEKEILKNAVSFEKDTLLMFHSFKKFVTDKKSAEAIQEIINEEYKHVEKLSQILKSL
jgi:rubrerythrin